MNNSIKIQLATAFAAILGLTSQAIAQYQPGGADRIAASPKLREIINERKTVPSTPSAVVASAPYQVSGQDEIGASPKLRERLNEHKIVTSSPSTAFASVGYQATGPDGIAASPKLREQIDQGGSMPVIIAPLK